jgi:NAD(P)-dependent dehydrogenase (short-subunit alcohol dehydrogenase family)
MADRLKGKVAIVIGAGTVPGPQDLPPIGNGRAAAILFAREGAAVLAVDARLDSALETKAMIEEEGGVCSAFQADVRRPGDCRNAAEVCVQAYGRIDILHNNVGIGTKKATGLLEAEAEDFDLVMDVNVKGIFHTCRAVLPQMLKQGHGAILNISSLAAAMFPPKLLIYSVSKAAVNAFTRCVASEFASQGIRVNCIMPGMIDSPPIYKEILPLYGGDIEKMRKHRNEMVPMKHMGEPWDIAYASLFLVSDESKFITGQVMVVDGGQLIRGFEL